MNTTEQKQYKTKVKKLIIDHLTSVLGYPECTDEQIIKELKPMWLKIEEANLKLPGMTFAHFVSMANDQYTFSQIKKAMGGR